MGISPQEAALYPAATVAGRLRLFCALAGLRRAAELRSALRGQAGPTVHDAAVLVALAAAAGTVAVWRMSRGQPRSRLL